jgi:hypothetical protein
MAIARGPGTEIIRTGWWEAVNATERALIIGVQHHIYTIISITVHAVSLAAVSDRMEIRLDGYDCKAGTTGRSMTLAKLNVQAGETFVWNNKFSFNGAEPVNFTGPMDDATKQDAIADQGTATAQKLLADATGADVFEIGIMYLDQNNA